MKNGKNWQNNAKLFEEYKAEQTTKWINPWRINEKMDHNYQNHAKS